MDALELVEYYAQQYEDHGTVPNRLWDMLSLRGSGKHKSGQYLSQGGMDVKERCSEATVKDIAGAGSLGMYPDFEEWRDGEDLGRRMLRLREELGTVKRETTPEDLERAVRIGSCFAGGNADGRWVMYVAVLVLEFGWRDLEDGVMLQGLRAAARGKYYP